MAGQCIRVQSKFALDDPSNVDMKLVDEEGTEYTIDSLFRVLYAASCRVVDEVYREEHDGTKQGRD